MKKDNLTDIADRLEDAPTTNTGQSTNTNDLGKPVMPEGSSSTREPVLNEDGEQIVLNREPKVKK